MEDRRTGAGWIKWLAIGALVVGALDITYAIARERRRCHHSRQSSS